MKKIEIVSHSKVTSTSHQIVANDRYLICTWQGWNKGPIAELLVLDLTEDKILWTQNFSCGGVGRPVLFNNCIYVASDEKAYCFALPTGRIIWEVSEKNGFFSDEVHPQLHNEDIFFFNCDEHCLTDIYAYNAATGTKILTISNILEYSRGESIKVENGFIQYNPGKNGGSLFSKTLYSLPDIKPLVSKIGDFCLHADSIFLKTKTEVLKYDVHDFTQPIWKQKLKTSSNEEKTFLGVAAGLLWIICEDQEGMNVASITLDKGQIDSKIRIEGSYLKQYLHLESKLIVHTNDSIVCIDTNDKKVLWSFDTDGIEKTRLVIHNNDLIYGDHTGYCAAINMQSGDMTWEFATPETKKKVYGGDFHVTDTHLYYGQERWLQKIPLTDLAI